MFKNLLASLVLAAISASAFAADPAPAVQYSRDANYIYVKQPLRLTFDGEQQAALKQAVQLMEAQLVQANALRNFDPNGDLKGLSDAIDALNKKVDLLVSVSGKLYGEVVPFGNQYFQALPTAAVIFAGVNADKNFLRFVQVGGSATLMGVFVPMQVTRISIKNPKDVQTRIDFRENSSLMLMGLGLGAVKVTPAAVAGAPAADAPNDTNKNSRIGVGLVWGELNSSSDLVGAIGGGTITVNVGAGVNAKLLGLKNTSKPGAINNYLLLVGVQKAASLNSKIPFTDIEAEFGANGGGILDLGKSIASTKNLAADFGALITGNRGKAADQ